jgi:hypothetical protein
MGFHREAVTLKVLYGTVLGLNFEERVQLQNTLYHEILLEWVFVAGAYPV